MPSYSRYLTICLFVWLPFILTLIVILFIYWNQKNDLMENQFSSKNVIPVFDFDFKIQNKIKIRQLNQLYYNPFSGEILQSKERKDQKVKIYLSSILRIDNKNFCLINNNIYREGDKFFAGKVIRIKEKQVIIYWKGKEVVINVGEEIYL